MSDIPYGVTSQEKTTSVNTLRGFNFEDLATDELIKKLDETNITSTNTFINSSGAIALQGANFGTSGQVLTSAGPSSAAVWGTGGDTPPSLDGLDYGTQGQVLKCNGYGNAATWQPELSPPSLLGLDFGTQGQVLKSNGYGNVATWQPVLAVPPVFVKAKLTSQQIPQQTGFTGSTGNGTVSGMTESFNSLATNAWSATNNEFTVPTKGFWNIRFALEVSSVVSDALQSCVIKIKLTPATGATATFIAQGGLNMGPAFVAKNLVDEWFINCNTIELLQTGDKISFNVAWVVDGTAAINLDQHGTHCDFLLIKEVS